MPGLRRVLFLLPVALPAQAPPTDWLIDPSPFVARAEPDADRAELILDNGLLRAQFVTRPDFALVSLRQQVTGRELVRSVRAIATLTIDGNQLPLGGLLGQPDHAFLLPQWLPELKVDPAALHFRGVTIAPIKERLQWQRSRPAAPDAVWPPRGVHAAIHFGADLGQEPQGIAATWHVELYDGLPLLSCWLEVKNGGSAPRELDSCTTVQIAAVEGESRVDPAQTPWTLPGIHVETDFAFCGMTAGDANSHVVHWVADPLYDTQVHYERQTPCLLQVRPKIGPAATLAPGGTFTSWRTFLLLPETDDADRRSLAQRRMYRVAAPWVTENPLMMHIRSADADAVRLAVDQCADVGFEMAILTFGSGFDIEDESAANLEKWAGLRAYAEQKGIHLGGYSLLSSRRISPDGDNCLDRTTGKPGGQRFGFAPALASPWGQDYFRKLYQFYERTGSWLLEHDGSYPGDFDAAARPPLQKGHDDSQWVQFSIIRDFYRWCRGRGVYLNVPDYYYLAGANKCGMGYRETNWSLPRDLQVLHTRQNLFDGTKSKTPSMGWMFVPLTEYHGGGAAATIEPLDAHRDHYERMLIGNLAFGAQACYRGPRLYDTEATLAMVRGCVDWYRAHRQILESDVVHGSSRRADGRDLDWVFHANARLAEKGMLVVFNPLGEAARRSLRVDVRYTGLAGTAKVRTAGEREFALPIDARGVIQVPVEVAAGGYAWFVFTGS
ncbi:MAG: alpha-galactosidase [Planctomycetes bacterium]|nr:alpha-galactosidase [Planctomycetota bacterium]